MCKKLLFFIKVKETNIYSESFSKFEKKLHIRFAFRAPKLVLEMEFFNFFKIS